MTSPPKATGIGPAIQAVKTRNFAELSAWADRAGQDIDCVDSAGNTALHWAANRGQSQMVQLLLAKGANPNGVNNNEATPLHCAAFAGAAPAVNALLVAGADPNMRNCHGHTVRDIVASKNHQHLLKVLDRDGSNEPSPSSQQGDHLVPDEEQQQPAEIMGTSPAAERRQKPSQKDDESRAGHPPRPSTPPDRTPPPKLGEPTPSMRPAPKSRYEPRQAPNEPTSSPNPKVPPLATSALSQQQAAGVETGAGPSAVAGAGRPRKDVPALDSQPSSGRNGSSAVFGLHSPQFTNGVTDSVPSAQNSMGGDLGGFGFGPAGLSLNPALLQQHQQRLLAAAAQQQQVPGMGMGFDGTMQAQLPTAPLVMPGTPGSDASTYNALSLWQLQQQQLMMMNFAAMAQQQQQLQQIQTSQQQPPLPRQPAEAEAKPSQSNSPSKSTGNQERAPQNTLSTAASNPPLQQSQMSNASSGASSAREQRRIVFELQLRLLETHELVGRQRVETLRSEQLRSIQRNYLIMVLECRGEEMVASLLSAQQAARHHQYNDLVRMARPASIPARADAGEEDEAVEQAVAVVPPPVDSPKSASASATATQQDIALKQQQQSQQPQQQQAEKPPLAPRSSPPAQRVASSPPPPTQPTEEAQSNPVNNAEAPVVASQSEPSKKPSTPATQQRPPRHQQQRQRGQPEAEQPVQEKPAEKPREAGDAKKEQPAVKVRHGIRSDAVTIVHGEKHLPGQPQMLLVEWDDGTEGWVQAEHIAHCEAVEAYFAANSSQAHRGGPAGPEEYPEPDVGSITVDRDAQGAPVRSVSPLGDAERQDLQQQLATLKRLGTAQQSRDSLTTGLKAATPLAQYGMLPESFQRIDSRGGGVDALGGVDENDSGARYDGGEFGAEPPPGTQPDPDLQPSPLTGTGADSPETAITRQYEARLAALQEQHAMIRRQREEEERQISELRQQQRQQQGRLADPEVRQQVHEEYEAHEDELRQALPQMQHPLTDTNDRNAALLLHQLQVEIAQAERGRGNGAPGDETGDSYVPHHHSIQDDDRAELTDSPVRRELLSGGGARKKSKEDVAPTPDEDPASPAESIPRLREESSGNPDDEQAPPAVATDAPQRRRDGQPVDETQEESQQPAPAEDSEEEVSPTKRFMTLKEQRKLNRENPQQQQQAGVVPPKAAEPVPQEPQPASVKDSKSSGEGTPTPRSRTNSETGAAGTGAAAVGYIHRNRHYRPNSGNQRKVPPVPGSHASDAGDSAPTSARAEAEPEPLPREPSHERRPVSRSPSLEKKEGSTSPPQAGAVHPSRRAPSPDTQKRSRAAYELYLKKHRDSIDSSAPQGNQNTQQGKPPIAPAANTEAHAGAPEVAEDPELASEPSMVERRVSGVVNEEQEIVDETEQS